MSINIKDKNKQYWLILSHCFNMDGRAASLTVTDKLPFLVEAGVEPIILSNVGGEQDKKYRHLRILPWGPSGLRFDLRHLIAGYWGRGVRYRLLVLLISLVLAPFIVLERVILGWQNHWSWALPATLRSLWIIYRYRPVILYSSGGSYSAHLAARWIKKLTGIKWIAEIHDPMVKPGTTPHTRNEKLMAYIEGLICKHADLAWWFTEGALQGARNRHPELGKRGVCILPGVGQPTVSGEYHRGDKMIISHFGSLSDTRSMSPIVAAMHELLEKKPEIRSKIRVHIYGGTLDRQAKVDVARYKLEDVFIGFGRLEKDPVTGMSGREQVVKRMFEADCLLLLHGAVADCREYIPSKLYEYLWTHRPVIALTYENPELNKLISERDGYLAVTDKNSEVVAALDRAYMDWQDDRLKISTVPAVGVQQAVERILNDVASIVDGV